MGIDSPDATQIMLLFLVPLLPTAFTVPATAHAVTHAHTRSSTVTAIAQLERRNGRSAPSNSWGGEGCHLLSDAQLRSVSDLLSDTDNEYDYTVCTEPSDDPTMTCFLKPSSWEAAAGEDGEWICMLNPSSTLTPMVSPEDSY